MKALVGAFNQEKASVIMNLRVDLRFKLYLTAAVSNTSYRDKYRDLCLEAGLDSAYLEVVRTISFNIYIVSQITSSINKEIMEATVKSMSPLP